MSNRIIVAALIAACAIDVRVGGSWAFLSALCAFAVGLRLGNPGRR